MTSPSSSSATYDPLPTNDSEQDITRSQTGVSQKSGTKRRNLLLITLGFLFTALAFYKAGQWSVSQSSSASLAPIQTGQVEGISESEGTDTSTSESIMPGKFSVG